LWAAKDERIAVTVPGDDLAEVISDGIFEQWRLDGISPVLTAWKECAHL
jgi:hypothetical protein